MSIPYIFTIYILQTHVLNELLFSKPSNRRMGRHLSSLNFFDQSQHWSVEVLYGLYPVHTLKVGFNPFVTIARLKA